MNSELQKVYCPLISKEISRLDCEDTATAAEGMQPSRFALKEIRAAKDWKEKCNKCGKDSQ